jgi:hypothetical protein
VKAWDAANLAGWTDQFPHEEAGKGFYEEKIVPQALKRPCIFNFLAAGVKLVPFSILVVWFRFPLFVHLVPSFAALSSWGQRLSAIAAC